MTEFHLNTLPNKIKVLFAPLKETKAVTVLVMVKVGSRDESKQLNGISHFIEHLLFKGTKKRPTSLHITKELDGVGADYNAFTGKDMTGYYIRVNHDKLELAIDIVSDMLYNSLFSATEINKERGVIIEEINMYGDNPMMMIDTLLEKLVFSGHALAREIIGNKKNIKNFQRRQFIDYFKKNYLRDNLVVGVAGNFSKSRAEKLIHKYFNKSTFKSQAKTVNNFASRQNEPRVLVKQKKTEQVHLALGYPAYGVTDERRYAMSVLSVILGGNMSSRLFLEIREKRGLAYYVRCLTHNYQETGILAVYAGLDKSKIDLAIKTIINELYKIRRAKVSSEELKRAIEYIKGTLTLRLEDSAHLIEWLATQQSLKGRVDDLETQIKKISRVTVADVQKAAKEIIGRNKANLAIIGPFKNAAPFIKILNKQKV